MATLKDISKATGISVTQVSRALGGHSDVNADTRKRVIAMANSLGYHPNAIARGLRTGRSGMIALILPAHVDESAQEILYEIVFGLSLELSQRGIKLVLHTADPDDDPVHPYQEMYWSGRMDGFVVLEPTVNDPCISFLVEHGIPHLVHGRDPQRAHSFVELDNHAIMFRMASHLIAQGHRRLALANGQMGRTYSDARSAGFRDALATAGATWVGQDQSAGAMTRKRGYAFLKSILASETPPTAIVASNMMLAAGIYDCAADLGLRIPENLSVLAHDDGLRHYEAASFDPLIGGTVSHLGSAWRKIADRIERVICLPAGQFDQSNVAFEFSPGQSTRCIKAGAMGTRGHGGTLP